MQNLEAFNLREIGKFLSFKVPHFADVSQTWSCSGSIVMPIDTEHV